MEARPPHQQGDVGRINPKSGGAATYIVAHEAHFAREAVLQEPCHLVK